MSDSHYTLGARWILPISGPPLRDPLVTVRHGKIAAIEPDQRSRAELDAGEVVLLPKLINAHTHLEFSHLDQPLGTPGNCITSWIPRVIEYRQSRAHDITKATVSGMFESILAGTAAIGEISTTRPIFPSEVGGCYITCFIERLGNSADRIDSQIAEARRWREAMNRHDDGVLVGLSPHAPYSVHPELFDRLIQWAIKDRLPVAMHLAESEAELTWLDSGSGPFFELLKSLDALGPLPNGKIPMDYLQPLSQVERALIVHGNYLTESDFDFLSQHRDKMFVVYCPRTHEYFQHRPYPLGEMLERGISVAVGTDSKASNPDLNVWRELKTVHKNHPDIDPHVILQMGTQFGAAALQIEDQRGQLAVGCDAEFLTFKLESLDESNLVESLFESTDEPSPFSR